MNNIIKFLLIPVIMVGINNSNCYSMENQNVIKKSTETNGVIKYSDNRPANENATFEQWTTRANFDPINVANEKYKNFNKFCEDHNLQQLREGIIGFLVSIYNLSHSLINNYEDSSSITTNTNRWIEQRTMNNFQKQEISNLEKQNAYYQLIHISNIKSIIRTAQEKLNPKKYSSKNTMNQDKYSDNNISDDISFDTNKSLNLIKCCYYLANQLVQLTHDIVYALNNEVKKYKETKMSNTEIYIKFKDYLVDEIVSPCYKALDQAFLLLKTDDTILLKSNKHNYFNTKHFLHKLNSYDIKHMNYIKYKFIYNISSLRIELLKKNNELSNNLKSNTDEILNIIKDIKNKFLKKLNISEVEKIIYIYNVSLKIMSNVQIIAHIDNREITSNNDIINMANEDLIRDLFFLVKKDIREDINRTFKLDVIKYIQDLNNNNNTKEKEKFWAEYKKLSKAIHNLNYLGNNIDMKFPNKDYLSEIEELLKRIG